LSSIGHMLRWVDLRDELLARPPVPSALPVAYLGEAGAGVWAETQGRELLSGFGVPVVPATLVNSEDDASAACAAVGGPCALKVCSADIPHKSDVGGVILGVTGPEAAAAAYRRIIEAVGRAAPGAGVDGVLVSPMRPDGPELLIGITVDPTFGPVLAVGLGGIWVEILGDVSLRPLPVDDFVVRSMLRELKGYPLLTGARGSAGADIDATAQAIVRITQAAASVGERLDSLEVNPLRITPAGPEALDVLVITRAEHP
jgi:acyl-CoA synthetase (NDP forming)